MDHIRPINRKGQKVLRSIEENEQMDVHGLQLPFGCTTVFDPGWEADSSGIGLAGGCQPMERDLYGCYGDCWWAAQVPDGMNKYPEWHQACPAAVRDWQKLKFVDE